MVQEWASLIDSEKEQVHKCFFRKDVNVSFPEYLIRVLPICHKTLEIRTEGASLP